MPKHTHKRASADKDNVSDSSSDGDAIYRKMRKLKKKLKKLDERDRYLASASSILSADSSDIVYSGESFQFRSDERAVASKSLREDTGGRSDEHDLDPSILALLGDDPSAQGKLSPPLHKNLAAAWTRFVKSGLNEEERKKLVAKHPPPENCMLIASPKVNPEMQKAAQGSALRRDQRLMDNQNQVGAALSALGQLITYNLSEEGGGNLYCLELASEASKLLLDLQHKQSITRRQLLYLSFHQELKDLLEETQADEFMYGSHLKERIVKELSLVGVVTPRKQLKKKKK